MVETGTSKSPRRLVCGENSKCSMRRLDDVANQRVSTAAAKTATKQRKEPPRMATRRMDEFVRENGAAGEECLAGMSADLVTNDPGFEPRRSAWIGATTRGVWIVQRQPGGWDHSKFYKYDRISLLEFSKNWLNVKVSFFGGDYKYATTNPAGAPEGFVDAVRPRMEAARRSAEEPKSSKQKEILEAISRLGELHASGALTSDEFVAKKAELLDRL